MSNEKGQRQQCAHCPGHVVPCDDPELMGATPGWTHLDRATVAEQWCDNPAPAGRRYCDGCAVDGHAECGMVEGCDCCAETRADIEAGR